MLPGIRGSKKSSFTVFNDSQDEGKPTAVPKVEIEVQTELSFHDAQENTTLSFAEMDKTSQDSYWCAVATIRAKQLDRLRDQNNEFEKQIASNREKKQTIDEEYQQLFNALAATLEPDDQDTTTSSTSTNQSH